VLHAVPGRSRAKAHQGCDENETQLHGVAAIWQLEQTESSNGNALGLKESVLRCSAAAGKAWLEKFHRR
jgi:hypothetical protein